VFLNIKKALSMTTSRPIRLEPTEFVDMLYKSILRRASDQEGREFHSQAIAKSGCSHDSISNAIESFVNSSEARDTLFTRDALGFLDLIPKFDDIISLGDHCLTSYLLKIYGLKKWSSPFDWLFCSPAMISHCLEDNFKKFLDQSFYIAANQRDDDSVDGRTIHRFYAENYGIRYVFNHHDLTIPVQYDYMLRCVERFRVNAKSQSKKLYLLIYDDGAYSEKDILKVNAELQLFCSNYCFAAVKVIEKTLSCVDSSLSVTTSNNGFYPFDFYAANKSGPLRLTTIKEELSLFEFLKSVG
jgi:Putative papain-like cysteine peptidase (DUF1796)/Domain of unknown function (DUF4214)